MKIVTLRYFKRHSATSQPFERLALESVLFSSFMVSMGLWSDEFNLNCTFDLNFWLHTEQLLNQTNKLPDPFLGVDSPVIGIPIGLLKLLLSIRQLQYDRTLASSAVLADLRAEISCWEYSIVHSPSPDRPEGDESEDLQSRLTRDVASLYILTASILADQIALGDLETTLPLAHDPDCWKLRRATSILRQYQDSEAWSKNFNATIPVYTIGFFMAKCEDIDLVRQDLQCRWEYTKFGHTLLCCNDLEATWAKRGYGR